MNFFLFLLWLSWKLKYSRCLECHQDMLVLGLCTVCIKRYQTMRFEQSLAKRLLVSVEKTQVSVFVAVPWSQKIKKKWYAYKFLKAYADTGLFVSLLTSITLVCIAQNYSQKIPTNRILLTHPPAKPNKAYPWGRIMQRLAAQQGWRYEPHLLVWQRNDNSPLVLLDQKTASSKQVRQQQRQGAFCATQNLQLLQALKENPPQLILLMDDIITTGSTLQGCLDGLETLLKHLQLGSTLPSIQPIVLTEVPL